MVACWLFIPKVTAKAWAVGVLVRPQAAQNGPCVPLPVLRWWPRNRVFDD